MREYDKILQGLGIPYSALLSIIFGIMLLSFPVGAYVFFNSDIGRDITHEYPLSYVDFAFGPLFERLPFEANLGDGFVVIWSIFVMLFGIGIFGPRRNFIRTLAPTLSSGKDSSSNYMVSMLKWFSILVFASAIIDVAMGGLGFPIEPPDFGNDLVQFFTASLAPIVEEVAFRVILIGLPLYAMFYRKRSIRTFVSSLWHPFRNLDMPDSRRALLLITTIGILFGMSHVVFDESWSIGKFPQAMIGGMILGWVYYRHGLVAAIMLHWATNYFILSYVYLVAYLNDISVNTAYSHPMLGTLEIVFVVSGVISTAFLVINYIDSRHSCRLGSESDTSPSTD